MRLFAQQGEEDGSADSEHPPLSYFTNERKTEASSAMRISSKCYTRRLSPDSNPVLFVTALSRSHLRCLTGQPHPGSDPLLPTPRPISPPSQGLESHPLRLALPLPAAQLFLLTRPLSRPTLSLNLKTTSILPSAPPFPFLAPAPARSQGSRSSPPTLTPNQFPFFFYGCQPGHSHISPAPLGHAPRPHPSAWKPQHARSRSITIHIWADCPLQGRKQLVLFRLEGAESRGGSSQDCSVDGVQGYSRPARGSTRGQGRGRPPSGAG